MKNNSLLIVLVTFLLIGCSVQPGIATVFPGTSIPKDRATITHPTATQTIVPLPTLSSTHPVPIVLEQCILTSATGAVAKGAIVLDDNITLSLIVKRGNELRIPDQPNPDNTASLLDISPSGPYFSYRERKQGNHFLVIRQTDGTIIQRFPWVRMGSTFDHSFQYSSQWINSNSILFRANYSSIKLFLVDADTGKAQELSTDFPQLASGEEINWGIDDHAIRIRYFQGANIVYDPSLTRAVYPKTSGIATLYDVEQKTELASIPLTDATAPEWSPNGKFFVIKAKAESSTGEPGDEFFIVPRNGPAFRQLTYLGNIYPGVSIGAYSWSPDSERIAFWMKPKDAEEYSLTSLDLNSGTITNYCIFGIPFRNNELSSGSHPGPVVGTGKPVWSPDQTQLLISQFDDARKHINVIVVDLKLGQAFKIKQDVEPVGWMKEP